MPHFLIDEDMPRSTAKVLRASGYSADDVRDIGLRGHEDDEVYGYSQVHEATLVTADKDFSNILRFPLGTHHGIIVLRVPDELSTNDVNQELLRALSELKGENIQGCLVIVEIGRIRIRRP